MVLLLEDGARQLLLILANTSAQGCVSDVHVCVAVPLLVPVILECHKIYAFLCAVRQRRQTAIKETHKTTLKTSKECRKRLLTHSSASSLPPPPSPAGASSSPSALQAVADVAMATAEDWQPVEEAVMSQPPSRSPDSLTGASVEISALQLVGKRGDGGTEVRKVVGEREGVSGKDVAKARTQEESKREEEETGVRE